MPDRTIQITLAQPGPDLHYLTLVHQRQGGDELALFASWAQEPASGTATVRGGSAPDRWRLSARGGSSYQTDLFTFDPVDGDTSATLTVGDRVGSSYPVTLTAHPSGHSATAHMDEVPLGEVLDHVVVIRVSGSPASGTPELRADPDRSMVNLAPGDRVWFSLDADPDVEWTAEGVAYKDIDLENPANAWLEEIPGEAANLDALLRRVEPGPVRTQTPQEPGCGWNSGTTVLRSGLGSDGILNQLDGDELVLNYTVTVRSRSQPDRTHTWDPEVDINMPGVNE